MGEITNEIRAEVYRELATELGDYGKFDGSTLRRLASEKDPPRYEPGTVVWWRFINKKKPWRLGLYSPHDYLEEPTVMLSSGKIATSPEIEIKPAHIPGPDEVVIPKDYAALIMQALITHGYKGYAEVIGGAITRAEAMEAEQ